MSLPKPAALERAVTALAIAAVPLALVGKYRYLPFDDDLRHAAKALSGKGWDEILVQRPGLSLDPHVGWHAVLSAVHALTGADAAMLVVFATVALFWATTLLVLPRFSRAEAWCGALVIAAIGLPDFVFPRLIRGRPFLVTWAVLLLVLAAWRLPASRPWLRRAATALGIGLTVWIHGATWYLWCLPVAAFLLAGRGRDALELGACWLSGALLGGLLTGHPVGHLSEHVLHTYHSFAHAPAGKVLVGEFQPFQGGLGFALALAGLAVARKQLTGKWAAAEDVPLILLAGLGWLGGLRVVRFFSEWGLPAALLWAALQLEAVLEAAQSKTSWNRAALACFFAAAFFLSGTADVDGRWSEGGFDPRADSERAAAARDPQRLDREGWLPGAGGIAYNDTMELFTTLFYERPTAAWRYALGYEPGRMTEENLEVLRAVQMRRGDWTAYGPWVSKLRAEDRLVVAADAQPAIPELEWRRLYGRYWFGRLRAAGPPPAP